MATRQDFAQKLLHDLRLRKERMATAQNSDMHRNTRQNFAGSRESTMLEAVGTKPGSRYRNGIKQPASVQTANQLVPYGGGDHSGQVADLSLALAYAFDNRGKLKRLDIASNGAMMNLLQQIGRRSMQLSHDIQWQSKNEFPTLTHLHIDEISKGAQKLNQILRACSSGVNINKGSIEIGKDLWKGAMELEQSLRMLVTLQEASDNSVSQQRKTRLKLLDDNGDSEDDSTGSSEKPKQVERPVFSFDRPSKNTKASVHTGMQQKLPALPYIEDPHSNRDRRTTIASKSTHRRSASCGSEIQTSQITNSSKSKHNAARLPNVIAKLMGLEELPKVATESTVSQQRSRESVSVHTAQSNSINADSMTEYTQNVKIQINQNRIHSERITTVTSHNIEMHGTYRSTSGHKTTSDPQKSRMTEEEGGMQNYVRESKAAIFKINEMQSKIIHLNQEDKSQRDIRKEAKVRNTKQKEQTATDATRTSPKTGRQENRSFVAVETIQADTPVNLEAHETQKAAGTSKPLLTQQTVQDFQQTNMPYEPQGKKLKAENRSQQKPNHKSGQKKKRNAEKLHNSRTVARDLKKLQKQLPVQEPNTGKKSGDGVVLAASKALLSNHNEDPVVNGKSTNSDDKRKSSVSVKSQQSSPSTNGTSESHITGVSSDSNLDAKCTHDSVRKVVTDIKPPKISPMINTNEEIPKTVVTPRTLARVIKPQKTASYRPKKSKLGKINVSRVAAQADKCIPKSMEDRLRKDEPRSPPPTVDAELVDNKYHAVRDESSPTTEVAKLIPGDKGENTISTISDDQHQKPVPDEVGFIPHKIATADQEDYKNNPNDQQQNKQKPTKMFKLVPLTEDEMFLKQKLIISHLFLNTAEALFKLNIPISILNYASDQICEEKDSKIILDSGYELLKRKGRKQELLFYPTINILMNSTKIRSLDDLVRELHKDFETLRSYGGSQNGENDYANCILKMLEHDIYNKHPDVNSMWDSGWNDVVFPCGKMDEIISNIEQLLLDELINEFTDDCM